MKARHRVRARPVIATVLLVAAACGVPTDGAPRQIPADRVPFDLLNPQLPAVPPPPSTP